MSDFLSLREVRRRSNLVQWESRNDRENTGQDGSVCSIARDCHVASGQAPRNDKHGLMKTRGRAFDVDRNMVSLRQTHLHGRHWRRVHVAGMLPALPERSQACQATLVTALPEVLDRTSK